jgi:heme/copper-type cytochrome/quinol oxidase subunit 2
MDIFDLIAELMLYIVFPVMYLAMVYFSYKHMIEKNRDPKTSKLHKYVNYTYMVLIPIVLVLSYFFPILAVVVLTGLLASAIMRNVDTARD